MYIILFYSIFFSFQLKIMKITIVMLFTIVLILKGSQCQNLTELNEKCQIDLKIWQNEASKWYRQYLSYIIISCLASVGGLVGVLCYYRRVWNMDSLKRLGFWVAWKMKCNYLSTSKWTFLIFIVLDIIRK